MIDHDRSVKLVCDPFPSQYILWWQQIRTRTPTPRPRIPVEFVELEGGHISKNVDEENHQDQGWRCNTIAETLMFIFVHQESTDTCGVGLR